MHPEEFNRKQLIQRIVDNPLWPEAHRSIRKDIMEALMDEKDSTKRDELFWEAQALERVVGRMTAIANEIRMEPKQDAA